MAEREVVDSQGSEHKTTAQVTPILADEQVGASVEASPDEQETARLLEHWKSTLELRNDQYRTFDKSVLAVSGGALAISIANVDKISAGSAGFTQLLVLSWLAFGLSIVSNISSYWTGTKDAERELEKIANRVEKGAPYEIGNRYRTATYSLNFLALSLFCAGVVLLSIHAYYNMEGANERKDTDATVMGTEGPADTQASPETTSE